MENVDENSTLYFFLSLRILPDFSQTRHLKFITFISVSFIELTSPGRHSMEPTEAILTPNPCMYICTSFIYSLHERCKLHLQVRLHHHTLGLILRIVTKFQLSLSKLFSFTFYCFQTQFLPCSSFGIGFALNLFKMSHSILFV